MHEPTRNSGVLTSQFLTPGELRQMLQHCYRCGDRQGLSHACMLVAILALGVYNLRLQVGGGASDAQVLGLAALPQSKAEAFSPCSSRGDEHE